MNDEVNKHNDPQPNHGNDEKGHNDEENRGKQKGHDIKPATSHGEPLCAMKIFNQ